MTPLCGYMTCARGATSRAHKGQRHTPPWVGWHCALEAFFVATLCPESATYGGENRFAILPRSGIHTHPVSNPPAALGARPLLLHRGSLVDQISPPARPGCTVAGTTKGGLASKPVASPQKGKDDNG